MNLNLRYTQIIHVLCIFFLSFTIFTISIRPFNTTDSYPNFLVSFNFLTHHQLDLTNLYPLIEQRGIKNTVIKNDQGTVYPKIPVIIGILNIPGHFVINKLYGVENISDTEIVFSDYPQYTGKYLASIYCAISAVLFYLILYRLFKHKNVSLVTTFIYVFATNILNTASQANWQHGISLLFINLLIIILLKSKKNLLHYGLIGFITILIWQIRISNLFYILLVFLVLKNEIKNILKNQKPLLFLIFGGLLIFIPITYLNQILKIPYGYESSILMAFKTLSPIRYILNLFSIFFSYNFGLFIYSPIFILSIFGIIKILKLKQKTHAEKFLFYLLPTLIVYLIFNAIWPYWTGGTSLDARMLTETNPIWCIYLAFFLIHFPQKISKIIFIIFLTTSIVIHLTSTFMIDGWWYEKYTKQDPENQLHDAWYDKPTLLFYIFKNRIIYFEKLKKENHELNAYFYMYRYIFSEHKFVTIYENKRTILKNLSGRL